MYAPQAVSTSTSVRSKLYPASVRVMQGQEGVSGTAFAPDAEITREQMVTMLWRYSGETAKSADLSVFSDQAAISAYARDAVAWAVESKIVDGMDDGTFQPQGKATRAQLAAILSRYMMR